MSIFEKSKRENTRTPYNKKWLFIIVFVLFLGIGSFGFLSWLNSFPMCFNTPFPSYEDVESKVRFELPLSAQNLEYAGYTYGAIGCTFQVKFDMAPEDLETFLRSTSVISFTSAQSGNDQFLNNIQSINWVPPVDSIEGTPSQVGSPDFHQEIFVDRIKPGKLTIYIRAYLENTPSNQSFE